MTSTGIMFPTELLKKIATGYSRKGKRVGPPTKGILPGSGALSTSATDMLKYLEANLGFNVPLDLLEAIHLTHQSYFKVNDKLSLGLAWQRLNRNGELIIDKNGGVPGFSSYFGMLPAKKIGIVILSNRRQKGPTEIGRKILLELSKNQVSKLQR